MMQDQSSSNILSSTKSLGFKRSLNYSRKAEHFFRSSNNSGGMLNSKNQSEHQSPNGKIIISRQSSQFSGATQQSGYNSHIKRRSQPTINLEHPNIQYSNHFFLMHGQDEAVKKIKSLNYCGQTLDKLTEQMGANFESLRQYKSEKSIQNMIQKLFNSHFKYKEISWIFNSTKPKDWTADFILQKIIFYSTKVVDRKLKLVKNKPEQSIIQFLYELNQKVEEMSVQFSENLYQNLESKFREDNEILTVKKVNLLKQFAQPNKLESFYFVKNLISQKPKLNFRLMKSDTYQQLQGFEQKYGHFKNIKNITRHTCYEIDQVINSLNNANFE